MSEQKLTIEALRQLNSENRPFPGTTTYDELMLHLWEFNGLLLKHIEQQDARINSLEEQVKSVVIVQDERIQAMQKDKDDQNTENWAHSEYSG